MFTFKSNNSENCDQKKRGSHDKGQSSNSSSAFTIKLTRTPSQKGTTSAFKKGILKNSGNNAIKLRPCESTETSSCYESASSDAESSSSCLTGKMRCCIQNEETHNSSNSRNSNSGRNRSYGFNRTALFVVVTAELLRTDAPWERKFGYLCRQERPYVPSTLLVSGCELSYLPRHIQIVFNLVHVNDQLTAVKIGYLRIRVT